eukprot:scaffold47258_cov73-Phaeocystis_antarctica.AAC.1
MHLCKRERDHSALTARPNLEKGARAQYCCLLAQHATYRGGRARTFFGHGESSKKTCRAEDEASAAPQVRWQTKNIPPHPDHAKNGLWSPAAAPLAGGASYRRQCSWARSRTRPAAADPTPRLVRVRRRCSARKAWPTSDRGLCTPPSAARQIALCRPGR